MLFHAIATSLKHIARNNDNEKGKHPKRKASQHYSLEERMI